MTTSARRRGGRMALVWAPEEGRTEMFAERLGADLHTVHYLKYKRPGYAPAKYVAQAITTVARLVRRRPAVVYVTNPPIFAATVVMLYGWVSRCTYVLDTHSPCLYHPKLAWTKPLQRFVARRALVNVVDQERFRELFADWGADAVVLERPPTARPSSPPTRGTPTRVTVINTFAYDEPLTPLLEMARMDPELEVRILGDLGRADQRVVATAPANVVFTDYLVGDEYWDELRAATVVVALTTFEYSLLAGCQDAIAVARPLVTSDQPVLRWYFDDIAVFADHGSESLLAAVHKAIDDCAALSDAAIEFRRRREDEWSERFALLEETIARQERTGARRTPVFVRGTTR